MTESSLQGKNMPNTEKTVLVISIFIAGLCSIIYELLISTTSSYFLGDSVKQFSITIGLYMAAMGFGSFISRLIKQALLSKFIFVEILLGLIGGASVPILYFVYANTNYNGFMAAMITFILVIGTLTGLEIPLLARIMKDEYPLKDNLSNVLSLDYLGALIATLLFPFFLLPYLGTFKSSIIFGIINIGVGFLNLWYFSDKLELTKKRAYLLAAATITGFFIFALVFSQALLSHWNGLLYQDRVVYHKQSQYQNIVLTKGNADLRLYLDGIIQFSSMDEHRYHESLVQIPMAAAPYKSKILILGGGEGLTAREVLKHKEAAEIVIVDLDPEIFKMAKEHHGLLALNKGSLQHPNVSCITMDAYVYLQENEALFDIVISDLPEPTNESLARLYSREFFSLIKKRMVPNGVFVTQAASPYHSQLAYWCIEASVEAAGFNFTYPYHTYVPSFGKWGFIMASDFPIEPTSLAIDVTTKFLETPQLPEKFQFAKDIRVDTIRFSTLNHPVVLEYYLEDYHKWGKFKK